MRQFVCYRPTVSHSLPSSNPLHALHVKNSISYPPCLRRHRRCIGSFDFVKISEAICQKNVAILPLSFMRIINYKSKVGNLQTSQKEENDRIPFYCHNRAVRPILLTNLNYFKMI